MSPVSETNNFWCAQSNVRINEHHTVSCKIHFFLLTLYWILWSFERESWTFRKFHCLLFHMEISRQAWMSLQQHTHAANMVLAYSWIFAKCTENARKSVRCEDITRCLTRTALCQFWDTLAGRISVYVRKMKRKLLPKAECLWMSWIALRPVMFESGLQRKSGAPCISRIAQFEAESNESLHKLKLKYTT